MPMDERDYSLLSSNFPSIFSDQPLNVPAQQQDSAAPGTRMSGFAPPLTGPPASVSPPCYVYNVGIPPGVVQHWTDYVANSEYQRAKLESKLQRQLQAEQAYQEILQLNGRTCVLGKNGRPQEVVNCGFPYAYLVEPQPPLHDKPFLIIGTSVSSEPLRITEEDFYRDSRLVTKLHSHPEVEVKIVGSQKRTALYLRLAITKSLKVVRQSPYAGWYKSGDGYHFQLLSNASSHLNQGSLLPPMPMADKSPDFSAVAAASAQQFWPVFRIVTNRAVRQTLVVWFYTSQVYTLLRELGFEMLMAPIFFSTEKRAVTYLKNLFSWYGDKPVSTNIPPRDFNAAMVARRDEPLLIIDECSSKRVLENIQTLKDALADHTVPWKSGREVVSLPLQASPIIVSTQVSSVCCVPETIIIDISTEDFEWSRWGDLIDQVAKHTEHRECFVRYTEAHIDDPRNALAAKKKHAITMSCGQLHERCIHTLAILLGMQAYLEQFFRFCAPAIPPIKFDDEITQHLFHLLKQTAEKDFMASLPEQFIYITQQRIKRGSLKLFPRFQSPSDNPKTVLYIDDDRLHFTPEAFFSVCKSMHQSRPVILRALADEGLFRGAQTNPGTAQTRIRVFNVHGTADLIPVYSLDRSRFEELGDPFIM